MAPGSPGCWKYGRRYWRLRDLAPEDEIVIDLLSETLARLSKLFKGPAKSSAAESLEFAPEHIQQEVQLLAGLAAAPRHMPPPASSLRADAEEFFWPLRLQDWLPAQQSSGTPDNPRAGLTEVTVDSGVLLGDSGAAQHTAELCTSPDSPSAGLSEVRCRMLLRPGRGVPQCLPGARRFWT